VAVPLSQQVLKNQLSETRRFPRSTGQQTMRIVLTAVAMVSLATAWPNFATAAKRAKKSAPSEEQLAELFQLLTADEQAAVVSIKAALATPEGFAEIRQPEFKFGYTGPGRAFLRDGLIKAAGKYSHPLSAEMATLVSMSAEEKVAFIAKFDTLQIHNQLVYAREILDLSKPVDDESKVLARKYPIVWRALTLRNQTPPKPVNPIQIQREIEEAAANAAARLAELRTRATELNKEIDATKTEVAKLEAALEKLRSARPTSLKERQNITDQCIKLDVQIELLNKLIAPKEEELNSISQEMVGMAGQIAPGKPR